MILHNLKKILSCYAAAQYHVFFYIAAVSQNVNLFLSKKARTDFQRFKTLILRGINQTGLSRMRPFLCQIMTKRKQNIPPEATKSHTLPDKNRHAN
ncbi:hypothetical protein A9993_03130 [Rahnella victoriana]|jgi:hypothetical protein|nr:hypothetical protein A9993_03130 [Rahnella victoriana]